MLQKINPLTVFLQYGYREKTRSSDGHSIGNCVFCGKEGHFFVNVNSPNKAWDCKVCGKGGGFKTFIEEIDDYSQTYLSKNIKLQKELEKSRGITWQTLKSMCVGYMPTIQSYTVPSYTMDDGELLNIKIYDGKTFKNTASCQTSMYGLWKIPKNPNTYDTVYITEGEWDSMVMMECLRKLNIKTSIVIGAPGAGVFKQDIFNAVLAKKICLLYDNDLAGRNGTKKAASFLLPVAAQVFEMKWQDDLKDGYDVRDLYKDNKLDAKITINKIEKSLIPISAEVLKNQTRSQQTIKYTAEPVPVKEIYDTFTKWLYMPDTTILDIIFGTVLANRLDGNPLWMFIVAPPGGTKTEPLMSMSGGVGIDMLSSLTPHTLISGMGLQGGNDPSLIPLLNNKVLIVKDFTTIWGLPSMEREEIISILRDAYDGECSKIFGNGIRRSYKSKFGILAATTPVIEQMTEEHAELGERFLRWRNWIPENFDLRKKYIERALDNSTKEVAMRTELSGVAKRVLLGKYDIVPTMTKDMLNSIVCLAQWISVMRGTVHRDKYTREILHKSCTELGTRVSKQLHKLALGIAMLHGEKEVSKETFSKILQVAKSSVSQRYHDAVNAMCKLGAKNPHGQHDIQKLIGLPTSTTRIIMENLEMLHVVEKIADNKAYLWVIKKDMYDLMVSCKFIENERKIVCLRKNRQKY
jgi:hypothetical protein